eukprot:2007379-Rhodomonas_salina.3
MLASAAAHPPPPLPPTDDTHPTRVVHDLHPTQPCQPPACCLEPLGERRLPLLTARGVPRGQDTVPYDQRQFSQAGYLVAPPLLLQKRVAKTTDCRAKFAGQTILSMWQVQTSSAFFL